MDRSVNFRPAGEADFNIILNLDEESFNTYDRLDRETLVELFTEFREGFSVIMVDGTVAGYTVFLVERGAGYIESIAITGRYRQRGLGRLAVRYMIERIKSLNLSEVNLHVRMNNIPAIALYEKEGFTLKEKVPGFYKDGDDAYLYTREVAESG